MLGINNLIIEHYLCVDPGAKKAKQRCQSLSVEKYAYIVEEVDHLLIAGLIQETHYLEWLSKVVLIKKKSGKWRMCVDLTDLNKDCLKDSFPLLSIDLIIDSTAGHQLLNFMDAYSGYNHICMSLANEEKTSFYHRPRTLLL